MEDGQEKYYFCFDIHLRCSHLRFHFDLSKVEMPTNDEKNLIELIAQTFSLDNGSIEISLQKILMSKCRIGPKAADDH